MKHLPVMLTLLCTTAFGAATWRNVGSRAWVADVAVDGDAVWFGYLGGGAARYEPLTGRLDYLSAADGLVHDYVTAVAVDGERVYFATRNGVASRPRAGGAFARTVRTWGYAHNDATDAAVGTRYVYLATLEGARLFDKAVKGTTIEKVPASEGPASKLSPQIEDGWKVYVAPDGVVLDDLYSVTVCGDVVYWGGRGRLFASASDGTHWRECAAGLPPDAVVRRVLEDGGETLVATSAGVFAVGDGGAARVAGPLGQLDVRDALRFAALDYFATREGLYVRRANGAPFKFAAGVGAAWTKREAARKKASDLWRLGAADGLPSSRCTALGSWGETVVVGTEDGACLLDPASGGVAAVPAAGGLPPAGVYALAYGAGRIWAATPSGLAAIDEADLSVQCFTLPGPWNQVRDVNVYGDEVVVTSSAGLAAGDVAGEARRVFDLRAAGFAGEGRRGLKYDGRYYLGTDGAVLELDAQMRLTRDFNAAAGFPPATVRALLPLGRTLLAATQGGGLAAIDLDAGAVRVLREGSGVSADVLFSLAADDAHVYVGTFDKGVDILDRELRWERNLSWGDGLNHTDIWAVAPVGGWLWLAIRGVGLNAYNLTPPPAPPPDAEKKKAPEPEVRRYYSRYGLGDEYVKAILVLPAAPGRTRLAFATASGVAILEFEGTPPDYAADDYDSAYP